ncbi:MULTISPECIES: ABC transporter ATP-binding protein [unclassified Streptomyces]|uniref:ABC transporter ATP-binding protein n=1 Tax=unclassified Streptomyces TaxID=2593676 RepID=UPI0004BFAE13|nr:MULTISPECIES: ABC transporter ATP-binding protein [unclassified Streptomyces]
MIQVLGLSSHPRKDLPPAVDDVSFEACAGRVTALLGAPGAGRTTVLRLMLELQPGLGVARFKGRPLHEIPHPAREVGTLLGDVPGHPARTVRGHLRMLCAATGLPARRADELLEAVGLVSLREERLSSLSHGLDRRLGLACALLPDPHTLVLDEPAAGLSGREGRWLHGVLRAHAERGGTVLFTTGDSKEAARNADRVVAMNEGRVVADLPAADFARTRLRPRVAVRSPHAARLAALLTKEARTDRRSLEVVREEANRLSVYGSTCADVGETAFRHGILVHQLADEVGDMGCSSAPAAERAERPAPARSGGTRPDVTRTVPARSAPEAHVPEAHAPEASGAEASGAEASEPSGRRTPDRVTSSRPTPSPSTPDRPVPAPTVPGPGASGSAVRRPPVVRGPGGQGPGVPVRGTRGPHARQPGETGPRAHAQNPAARSTAVLPGFIHVRPAPSPLQPLRYELRRAAGVGTGYFTTAAVLLTSALIAVLLAHTGHTPQHRLLAAWPQQIPLPPAALGAGLLGAIAFGDEFRHPALAADRGTVPRRLGLLTAKLLVSGATALLIAFLALGCDLEVLYLVYGQELTRVPGNWLSLGAGWFALVVGCAWAGVLAAGLFRSTTAGLAAVLAVPVAVVPLVQHVFGAPSVRAAAGITGRLRELTLPQWPFGGERYVAALARLVAQPVGGALTLSLGALLCAYVCTTLRTRAR